MRLRSIEEAADVAGPGGVLVNATALGMGISVPLASTHQILLLQELDPLLVCKIP